MKTFLIYQGLKYTCFISCVCLFVRYKGIERFAATKNMYSDKAIEKILALKCFDRICYLLLNMILQIRRLAMIPLTHVV